MLFFLLHAVNGLEACEKETATINFDQANGEEEKLINLSNIAYIVQKTDHYHRCFIEFFNIILKYT